MTDWDPTADSFDSAEPPQHPKISTVDEAPKTNAEADLWEDTPSDVKLKPADLKQAGEVVQAKPVSSVSTTETDEWGDSMFVEGKGKQLPLKSVTRRDPLEKPLSRPGLADDEWGAAVFQEGPKPSTQRYPPTTDDWGAATFKEGVKPPVRDQRPPPAADEWSAATFQETSKPQNTQRAPQRAPFTAADEWGAAIFQEGVKSAPRDPGRPQRAPPADDWGGGSFQDMPRQTRNEHSFPQGGRAPQRQQADEWESATFTEGQKQMNRREPKGFQDRQQFRPGQDRRAPQMDEWDAATFQEPCGQPFQSRGPSQASYPSRGPPQQSLPPRHAPQRSAGDDWDSSIFQERPTGVRRDPQGDYRPQNRGLPQMEDWGNAAFQERPQGRGPPRDGFGGMGEGGFDGVQRGQGMFQDVGSARQPRPHEELWGSPQSLPPRNATEMGQSELASRFDLPPFSRDLGSWQDSGKVQPPSSMDRTPPPPGFAAPLTIETFQIPERTVAVGQGAAQQSQIMEMVKNIHGDRDFYAEDLPMDTAMLERESHFKSDVPWESFGLPAELIEVVRKNKYEFPSKIQAHGIQLLMKEQYDNVVVQAPTGSGKTLTFVLSTLAQVDKANPAPQVICIAPTVELLTQLTQEYIKYAQPLGIAVAYLRKGSEHVRSHVLLMTPAQAAFVFQVRRDDMQSLRFFVLDEADHILNKEDQQDFAQNMSIVIKQLPPTCHVLLFSATYSETMRRDFDQWLERGFIEIAVPKEDLVLENIKMFYVKRGPRDTKLELLMKLLKKPVQGVTVIFVNTVRFAQVLSGILTRRGCKSAILVGRCMAMGERALTLEDFKRGFYDVVVSTNLLARGIDNTHIARVINFDVPAHWSSRLVDAETYLHRIGRAGRFTRAGEAITIIGSDPELKMLEDVMMHYGCEIECLKLE